jgi:hypothetical protein
LDASSARWRVAAFAGASLVGLLTAATAHGGQGDCSQPLSAGLTPVATDCLFILGVAVGLQSCTPEACVCDPTGDGGVAATDALTCLKNAVGEPISLDCPCGRVTTTTTVGESDCIDDGDCGNDDCVCDDCDSDLFCSDPGNCIDDGSCQSFQEGCVCPDCASHPDCLNGSSER